MSLVLVGPSGSLGRAVFERVRGQGDSVRVIEADPRRAEEWKSAGAYVAVAAEWDADLIERASYEARSIVIFPSGRVDGDALLDEIARGAQAASVDRIIVIRSEAFVPDAIAASGIDHVVIAVGKSSRLRRTKPVDDGLVALAVDAADDLGGHPRLAVDLTRPEDLRLLHL